VDLAGSARRNITLAIGTLLGAVPLVGWVAGTGVGTILGLVESALVLLDPRGRRLGDRIANTQVVESQVPGPAQTGGGRGPQP